MPDESGSGDAIVAAETREPTGWLARWRRRWRSRPIVVHDHSMEPTFRPGDRLWVDLGAYRDAAIVRNDVVVIADPARADRRLLKRVVGIGGDFVRVSREGIERVARPTGEGAPPPEGALEELEVPEGYVFVLSDRRANTRDSRQFGPIPVSAVLGRVWQRRPATGR